MIVSPLDDTEDEELVHVDPDPLVILNDRSENRSGKTEDKMGIKLQALLYYGLAKPIIKARWIILGKVYQYMFHSLLLK